MHRRPSRRRVPVLLLALLCLSCGPGQERKQATDKPADRSFSKRYERGPLLLDLKLDRKEITIAERVTLSLEATVDEGTQVGFPAVGDIVKDFGLVDFSTTEPKLLSGGKVLIRRDYVLEPVLSGDYTIPALTVRFADHQLETEPVTVTVRSILPEDRKNLAIKDIVGPQSPPRSWIGWVLGGGAVLLACAAAAGAFLYVRRRRGTRARAAIVPAHEIAFAALEKLVGEHLVEKGECKEFYIRITDILRRYVENRFGYHAPQRSTEEFLEEIRREHGGPGPAFLGPAQKALLAEFLTRCDLVKFAAVVPQNAEIQATFDSCRDFIVATASGKGAA